MKAQHLFNLFILVAVVVIVALTVREVAATSSILAKTEPSNPTQTECSSLPARYSIHGEYVEETGTWMTYSEDAPTGVDGGLIHLLSAYRSCSQ